MRHVLLPLLLLLAGCATARGAAPAPEPDRTPLAGQAMGETARLYGDCIAAAQAAGDVVEAHDGGAHLMLFRCKGAPARALHARLGPWSAKIGSEWQADGRTWRSSAKVQRDLVGVDYCSAATGGDGGDAACNITLNVGDILAPGAP